MKMAAIGHSRVSRGTVLHYRNSLLDVCLYPQYYEDPLVPPRRGACRLPVKKSKFDARPVATKPVEIRLVFSKAPVRARIVLERSLPGLEKILPQAKKIWILFGLKVVFLDLGPQGRPGNF
jgi:hypothetical protein